jgi:hypothetical protein
MRLHGSSLTIVPAAPDLCVRITNAMPDMPEGSEKRRTALMNLRNIRFVLARRNVCGLR